MTKTKSRLSAIVAFAALALVIPATAQAATPTFTQLSLTSTVTGTSVKANTKIKASTATVVEQYGVCVRDSANKTYDFAGKAVNATISTTGTAISTGSQTLPVGVYSYYPCVKYNSAWITVGAKSTFEVKATATPSPTPTPTPTPTPSPTPTGPAVLFEDNFDGAAGPLTSTGGRSGSKWTEWSACTYNGSAAYAKIGCFDAPHKETGVPVPTIDGNGHARIPATPDHGSSVSTKDNFKFTTGIMTARMKIGNEKGYWPAFWSLNNNPSGADAPLLGEVDVLEAWTGLDVSTGGGYRRAVHTWVPGHGDQQWSGKDDPFCGAGKTFGQYHDYSAKVETDKVTFYFDGVQCGPSVLRSEQPDKPWGFAPDIPASQGNWPILTMAVGGAGGQQDPGTGNEATVNSYLEVDSVKVTALS
jgi:hypothetical protein